MRRRSGRWTTRQPGSPELDEHATLIDVETVVSVRGTAKVGRWLWQVLLHAWLETTELYRIRRVGLLLARHGVLITWPVDEQTEPLLGRRDAGDRDKDQAAGGPGHHRPRPALPRRLARLRWSGALAR
ncbi:hypothetical protein [Amycolatopsis viridis]|uniref:Transposase n=1 Tax=Amycolatopsis viridis TaxID=185678 RepID=A0ABX0SY06_9PSEU|nr:hypothetical protein [Amycolatopsis viridis]NIH81418.1 hypothetical protein [Amycolatopsis viridis]